MSCGAFHVRQKRTPVTEATGVRSVFSAVIDGPFSNRPRAAQAAACTAGIAPTEAAYSSPHVQSDWVTDHLHFLLSDTRPNKADGAQSLAQPSRGTSRVTVGRGRDGRFTSHDWDAGLSYSLYCPPPGSFSRKRLSGNASMIRLSGVKDQLYRNFLRDGFDAWFIRRLTHSGGHPESLRFWWTFGPIERV